VQLGYCSLSFAPSSLLISSHFWERGGGMHTNLINGNTKAHTQAKAATTKNKHAFVSISSILYIIV